MQNNTVVTLLKKLASTSTEDPVVMIDGKELKITGVKRVGNKTAIIAEGLGKLCNCADKKKDNEIKDAGTEKKPVKAKKSSKKSAD